MHGNLIGALAEAYESGDWSQLAAIPIFLLPLLLILYAAWLFHGDDDTGDRRSRWRARVRRRKVPPEPGPGE